MEWLSELSSDHEGLVALATFLLVVATLILAGIAAFQINASRLEAKKTATLTACSNYDLNPVIVECQRRIHAEAEAKSLKTNAKTLRVEILTLLNFLDAIAIGIDQGLYIEDLAYDHLSGIIAYRVEQIIDSGVLEAADCNRNSYLHLIDLKERWARANPRFHDGHSWIRRATRPRATGA